MRKSLFIISLLFCCATFAQKRVNGGSNYKIEQASPIVTNIIGWSYNSSVEKWTGCYNAIAMFSLQRSKDPDKIQTLTDKMMSVCENTISIQIKKVAYKDQYFYLFYKRYWAGAYRYPHIKKDWYHWNDGDLYVLEEDEYKKLYNLDSNITNLNIYYISYAGHSGKSSKEDLTYIFKSDGIDLSKSKFPISVYPTCLSFKKEDENTIRFLTPSKYMYINETDAFAKQYYEMDFREFEKLLIK